MQYSSHTLFMPRRRPTTSPVVQLFATAVEHDWEEDAAGWGLLQVGGMQHCTPCQQQWSGRMAPVAMQVPVITGLEAANWEIEADV